MPHLTRRDTLKILIAAGASGFAREALAADAVARVTFLLVSDFYRIEQNKDQRGGIARLAAVVGTERARAQAGGRRLFFVHAGDALSPSLLSSLDSGAHMIALFNELGLDAFVPGNHEFDFGKDIYLQRMGKARFPILAANLRGPDGAELQNHQDQIVFDVEGLKIAMIGSAYDETPSSSRPGDLVFGQTMLTMRQKAELARAAGADFIVAVIHADRVTGTTLMNGHVADLILSGHNHDLHIGFDGRSALMESQADAFYLAAVDIDIAMTRGTGGRLISWWPRFRPIDTASFIPDPGFVEKASAYESRLAQVFNAEIGSLAAPLDSRTELVRSEETAIGNLFTDALCKATGAEIALINGGGIRGNRLYPTGTKLTRRDIIEELPFDNKTIVAEVPGKAILAALENGFSQIDRMSGRFPQVAGLSVVANRSAPLGGRVQSAAVRGRALDPAQHYRLVTNDFLARGGDGYWMFAGEMHASVDSGMNLVAQDVIDHIEALKVVEARVEGRIVLR